MTLTMLKRTKRLASLVFLAGIELTNAQQPGSPLKLSDAKALALKNHPQVLASQATYLRADQIVTESKAAYYPVLNGEITGSQGYENARIGSGFLQASRLFNHFGTGLSLSQLITDSGRTPNLVTSSKLQAQAGRQNFRATQYDVVLGVEQAYFEALLSQDLVKLAQQTVATRQTLVDQVSELTKNKLKSEVDLSFAQVNLSDAQLMLLRAQDRLQTAYASLAQAMGTQEVANYQLIEEPMPPAPPAGAEDLIKQAFDNRPEVASYRLMEESDQKFARAERDLKLPTVNLVAVGGALPYINPGNANPNIPLPYEGVAVNVQVPIFNGHLFTAREHAADYQLVATQQQTRNLEDRIARDVRASYERAKTSFEAIAATEQLVKQANLALNLAQGRYNLGLSSIVELSQAQLGQTQAEVENLDAKFEYQESYQALQYTLGLLR